MGPQVLEDPLAGQGLQLRVRLAHKFAMNPRETLETRKARWGCGDGAPELCGSESSLLLGCWSGVSPPNHVSDAQWQARWSPVSSSMMIGLGLLFNLFTSGPQLVCRALKACQGTRRRKIPRLPIYRAMINIRR